MQPKRTPSFFITLCIFSLLLVLSYCTKRDDVTYAPPADSLSGTFYKPAENADPAIKTIAVQLKRQRSAQAFAARANNRAGMPQWAEAMRVAEQRTGNMGIPGKTEAKKSAYFIPFVKKGNRNISALLMIKIRDKDTAYKMIYRQHYLKYGFEERAGRWNARTVMLLFAIMEEQVFGYKNFMVNDGRIMGGKIGERFRISFEEPATSRDPSKQLSTIVTNCKNYKSCFTVGGPMICNTRSICKTTFVEEGGPGEWENFQPDEWDGGGETSDGGIVDEDPCEVQPGTTAITWQDASGVMHVLNPCDEHAWEAYNIENNVQDPCLKTMVESSISKDVDNEISNFMKSAFGVNPDLDLIFQDADLGIGIGSNDGITNAQSGRTTGYCKITITLNARTLPFGTKEYILSTIFHESLHAWIELTQSAANAANNISHETMTTEANINLLASSLRKMYPNITPGDAIDLAWGGLQETSAWTTKLKDEDRARINQTLYNYSRGYVGTRCNP